MTHFSPKNSVLNSFMAHISKNRLKVATMTLFCTFGTVTPGLIIGLADFSLIDIFRSQAALMQVSSTLLNSDSRTRVKCENIFCVSLWQITSHNAHPVATMTHLKSIENSNATMTQPAKNFNAKRFCTSDRNATFVVLF